MKHLQAILLMAVISNFSNTAQARPETPSPRNWAETLRAARTLNSKPRAKDAQITAQKELTEGARAGKLPTISLNANISGSGGRSDSTSWSRGTDSRFRSSSLSGSSGVGLSLNWTLFQCGYHYFTLETAKLSESIMVDAFNSTKSFVNNTKASVVINAFNSYQALLSLNDQLTLFKKVYDFLDILTPIANLDKDAKASLENTRAQFENAYTSISQSKDTAIDTFIHWTTLAPSPQINSLQDASKELTIPENYIQAFDIALKQSPDIRLASKQIEIAQLQIKIAQTELCPQVNLNMGLGYNFSDNFSRASGRDFESRGQNINSNIGISVSVPIFNKPIDHSINYQKSKLIADKLERDAALEDSKFELKTTYKNLKNMLRNKADQEVIIKTLEANIDATLSDIAQHQHLPDPNTSGAVVSYVSVKLQLIGNYLQARSSLSSLEGQILSNKFSILRTMGTVFSEDAYR